MEEDMINKPWKEWTESGITEKTIAMLEAEDITTLADFAITTEEDRADLRKAGISGGQIP